MPRSWATSPPLKRTALLACAVHVARQRVRDDLAEMSCKRMASITKQAKTELEEIRAKQAEISERLIEHYRDVLVHLDPRSPTGSQASAALALARAAVERAGGFDAELADIDAVAAHHANHYMPLVDRNFRRDRATMFAFARTVELEATSADLSVLDALDHAVAHSHLTRDLIPGNVDGVVIDLSFASEQWQRLVRGRDDKGRLSRRHFEACVFTYPTPNTASPRSPNCSASAPAPFTTTSPTCASCDPAHAQAPRGTARSAPPSPGPEPGAHPNAHRRYPPARRLAIATESSVFPEGQTAVAPGWSLAGRFSPEYLR